MPEGHNEDLRRPSFLARKIEESLTPLPQNPLLEEAGTLISQLGRLPTLYHVWMSMDRLNHTFATDVRAQIIQTYNASRNPIEHLPDKWDENRLGDGCYLDVDGLYNAFKKVTKN